MRDFLPADVRRREYVIGIIRRVYEHYAFEPLETPAAENIETLMGKYGEEGNQLIFKILKRGVHESTGEADLALRYDLTVPLARVVAEYRDKLPKFFKRYQIQPVWRADRPARGRFREFYQCDADILGSRSPAVEAELIAASSEALFKLGFYDFDFRVNHRQALTGMLLAAGVPPNKHDETLVAVDKLDKIGRDGVAKELQDRGVAAESAARLLEFFLELRALEHAAEIAAGDDEQRQREALNAAILGRLVEFIGDNELGAKGVDVLKSVVELSSAAGVGRYLKVDPSLARGLSYYTGTIMEANVKDLPGSLGGGGRYDNLIGMFSGHDVPACGFSLGLERIIVVMTERGMFPPSLATAAAAEVMILPTTEDLLPDSLSLANSIRKAGVHVDLYPEIDKLGKQLKYAATREVALVVIVGEDEKSRGEVSVKDMRTGEQTTVKWDSVPLELVARLSS
jgi:histidyl-tRNA synthetase